jgi:hypothetical protein
MADKAQEKANKQEENQHSPVSQRPLKAGAPFKPSA